MLATDRCDRCGAQAYTAWWKPKANALLLFCAHHTRQHEAALDGQAFELTIDDREALTRSVREPEPA